ncbi:membrane protein YigM [Escherichia coli]|uniref:Membrane protein YigM n=1 Tax=Escherichia coli TaxID=562 RepID=A0A2X1PSR0_ECOLX|nr:membrane protein YigM [Escherichia coli]
MALLIITTILWAFSFSFYGEYLAGHVDSYFAVLVRVGLAALVFLPFLRTRGNSLKTVGPVYAGGRDAAWRDVYAEFPRLSLPDGFRAAAVHRADARSTSR